MEKPVKKVREQGTCPYCGGTNIFWRDIEYDVDFMFHHALCDDCEKDFTEVYKITYDGYNTFDENGEEHLFDKKGNEL